jgi:signal transduction histidine kinase
MSYRAKLLLGLFCVALPMFLILTIIWMLTTMNLIYDRELDRIGSLSQLLINEINHDINHGEISELYQLLSITSKEPSVNLISIIDQNNMILYSTDSSLQRQHNLFPDSHDIRSAEKVFFVSFPLKFDPNLRLQIGYSLQDTHHDFKLALIRIIVLDTAIITLTLIVAWLISGYLIKPLEEMKIAATKITRGDFNVRLNASTADVIGKLAGSFNEMASSLGDLTGNLQTKINDATAELAKSNERLRELDRLKSDFVAMVSHELRTPLTSIIGFAKTLQRLNLPESQRDEFLKIIEKEGRHLSFLIEEYLDISKIESGNFSIKRSQFDLFDLAKKVIHTFRIDKGVNIEEFFPAEHAQIEGDVERIRMVLTNLIDNAKKYGGTKIVVSGKKIQQSVCIKVEDNGKGIVPEEREKVFEKFYRGNNSSIKGNGLGLAIARGIINEHGGRIRCESGIDGGAAFVFELPIHKGED